MSVLPTQIIRRLCRLSGRITPLDTRDIGWLEAHPARVMIHPYYERGVHRGKTFGLGPAGYDVRIREDMWLWPFWGRLASTIERFDLPADITFLVQDKSSWARRFVFAMNTNGEPGWQGHLTLELVRFLPWPVRIRAGSPIANIIFLKLVEPTEQPYDGKYQNQEPGPQAARDSTHAG